MAPKDRDIICHFRLPDGRRVGLSRGAWYGHILKQHSQLARGFWFDDPFEIIGTTLTEPSEIRQELRSVRYARPFFVPKLQKYCQIKVWVRFDSPAGGYICTAAPRVLF